jgi:hypothetical protein
MTGKNAAAAAEFGSPAAVLRQVKCRLVGRT